MKIASLMIFAILIIPNMGLSHTMSEVKDSRFREIADSLINSSTNSELKEAIVYQRTWEDYYTKSDTNFLKSDMLKGVSVYYDFINSCNQSYYYQTKHIRRGGFTITFDLNHIIVKQPNFEFLKTVVVIHDSCFISYEIAEAIAIKNFNPKSRKTWTNQLVYDLLTNKVYWLIERESGFQNGILESIKIDAKTKEVIEKSSMPFKKGFFKALIDNIDEVP